MRDELLTYYHRELVYLREMGKQFQDKYPGVASELGITRDKKYADPHTERLVEAFAFLAARVHLKIDDELPEISEAILNIIYPHFLRPLPSMTIVQVELDTERGKLTGKLPLPSGSILRSRVRDVDCKFSTTYETELWPIQVGGAEWTSPDRLRPALKYPGVAHAIRVRLDAFPDVELGKLDVNRLRFFLDGEDTVIHTLYEALCTKLVRILVREPDSRRAPLELPASSLRPLGFEGDEGMLPYPGRSFAAYRLLQEYFAFPAKFFFLELDGLAPLLAQGFTNRAELIFLLAPVDGEERRQRLEQVKTTTFRLGCAPVINLFDQTCDPIRLDQASAEYPIPIAKRPDAYEIFSIEKVLSQGDRLTMKEYLPFYSMKRQGGDNQSKAFWIATRRMSTLSGDAGTDMDISFVDLSMQPLHPQVEAVTVKALCTNRELPTEIDEGAIFELEISGPIKRIVALRKPTPPRRLPVGKAILWRLISHLSLNYLSLVEDGKDALQEILRLYDFSQSAYNTGMINGIVKLDSRRGFAKVGVEDGIAFARGVHVEIEFNEDQFVGGGVYLFSSVLERFLASYATLNSFCQLTARSRQRKEPIQQWEPRAGQKILM